MYNFLLISQAVLSIGLTVLVLLQANGSSSANIFGGGGGETYHTRKGIEKLFFYATIVTTGLFTINSLALLFY